jgi:glutamyl-Q tRNA(Asp) synthetase
MPYGERGHAAPGPPGFRDLQQLGGIGPVAQAFEMLKPNPKTHIGAWHDVVPSHGEHQIDLGRPAADAFGFHQLGDGNLVFHRMQSVEVDPALDDVGRQRHAVTDLLAAETGLAQNRFARGEEIFRRQRIDQDTELFPDGAGRMHRHLLANDGAQQCGVPGIGAAQGRQSALLQRPLQIGIDARQVGRALFERTLIEAAEARHWENTGSVACATIFANVLAVDKLVTRFAPSPTGLLHLGHARSALEGWTAAQESGGRFLLRIEDIDTSRCREEFVAAIFDDLAWLGLRWEEPVRRQSQHFDDYRVALQKLQDMDLVYPCFCTRQDIQREIEAASAAPHGPDGPLYPGTCRHLSKEQREEKIASGRPYAFRLDVSAAAARASKLSWHDNMAGEVIAQPKLLGDVVLARKDTPTSYHLSVTVDDHLQSITLVTRGRDLFEATHIHRLLQALLGYASPRYRHHDLLTDESGRRLAKRDKALTLQAMRESGLTPADVRARAGFA